MQIANMISENNACESSQTKWQVICCYCKQN